MAQPSDLVAHYSSLLFRTRIYALTLIATVLGATLQWAKGPEESSFVGLLLILIVTSLGEANRRYTHSYLCACLASSDSGADADAASWLAFRKRNEHPWSGRSTDARVARFMLYWSTYIPGVVGGWYLMWRDCQSILTSWIGSALSICAAAWWGYTTWGQGNLRANLKRGQEAVQ